jgi:hypothetical protein
MSGRAEWRSGLIETGPAVVFGLTSKPAGGGSHGAGGVSSPARRVMSGALKLAAI